MYVIKHPRTGRYLNLSDGLGWVANLEECEVFDIKQAFFTALLLKSHMFPAPDHFAA